MKLNSEHGEAIFVDIEQHGSVGLLILPVNDLQFSNATPRNILAKLNMD